MGVSRARFYFDIGSPLAYVAAERVNGRFLEAGLEVPEWKPVLSALLNGPGADEDEIRIEAERAVSAEGLPPIRWPEPWPFDSTDAMLAATFAKQIGRTVAFSLAAFRQAFAAGRDLSVSDNVLVAGAACELHPRALSGAIARDSIREALDAETMAAADASVRTVPAIEIEGHVSHGLAEIGAALPH